MGQPESGDGAAAADPAGAGQGAPSQRGQELQEGEEGAELRCQCRRTQDMELAADAAAQPGVRRWCCCCCCCPRCLRGRGRATPGTEKSNCPGLGLYYALLSALLFSVVSLFLKTIEDVHSVEASAFRCIFQITFVLPGLIYHKTGFLGPKDKQIFLFFRGFLGSCAMILLYYAFQLMPLADATVISFSSPAFTTLFAWIFLKEKYSPWDLFFVLLTITGVVFIARPPFLFGPKVTVIEGNYTDHLKGTAAALISAVCAASTFVIIRKVGKSVHYFLTIWYYAIVGLIICIITLFVLDSWSLPYCGRDRFLLILIGLFGLCSQIFLTKALQIEKAGPVAVMKTMSVVFAFIFQIIFLNNLPTWWSFGGALCVVASSIGTVIWKWKQSEKTHTERMKSDQVAIVPLLK